MRRRATVSRHRSRQSTAVAKPKTKNERVRVEISAGGVVFKRTPGGLRVALIMDPYEKWTFAKGHVESGETPEQAALRETREEMGLGRLRTVAALGKIDFWFRDRYREGMSGRLIHKYVHYFLLEAPPGAKGQPQKQEQISGMRWVDLAQLGRISGYRDTRPIVRAARVHLARLEP